MWKYPNFTEKPKNLKGFLRIGDDLARPLLSGKKSTEVLRRKQRFFHKYFRKLENLNASVRIPEDGQTSIRKFKKTGSEDSNLH